MAVLPTLEQLLGAFEAYNLAIWPIQLVAYLLGFVALFLAVRRTRHSSKIIAAILSLYSLWVGTVFCVLFWARSYPLAYVFAVMSAVMLVIQGVLLLVLGVLKPRLSFRLRPDVYGVVGALFVAYAMIGYPVVGYLVGHVYPRAMPFGLVPCPTVVFMLGLLLWTDKPVPRSALVIPFIAGLSGLLPVSIGVFEDVGLVVAALVGTALILYRDRKALAVEEPGSAEAYAS